MLIRDAAPADFEQLLGLNEESERFLSPLNLRRLEHLHNQAAYHRVLETDGRVVAFLLAFREGCNYDSPNYRWFVGRFDSFIYIDRIVVAVTHQGRSIGRQLYEDLFSFAKQCDITRVVCEFDKDPPNEASRRFHEHFGFTEVGTRMVASGEKQVSLRAVSIARSRYQLAQLNTATMKAPLESPLMAEFVANLERINALAESSTGFVWRLKDESGDATAVRHFGENILVNMSVWEDVESLHAYAFQSAHVELLRKRRGWFDLMTEPYAVLWWIPRGHQPSLGEAAERLEHLRNVGVTSQAFTFRKAFPPPDRAKLV